MPASRRFQLFTAAAASARVRPSSPPGCTSDVVSVPSAMAMPVCSSLSASAQRAHDMARVTRSLLASSPSSASSASYIAKKSFILKPPGVNCQLRTVYHAAPRLPSGAKSIIILYLFHDILTLFTRKGRFS